jgi:hypothetical protein
VSGRHLAGVIELIGRPLTAEQAGVRGPEFAPGTKTSGDA